MNIRFTESLKKEIDEFCLKYNIDLIVFATRAVKKWNRVVNDVVKLESIELTTYKNLNPTTLRINPNLIEGKTPKQLKQVFKWYLNDQRSKEKAVMIDVVEEEKSLERDNVNMNRLAQSLANY